MGKKLKRNNRSTGNRGEDQAAAYLVERGYRIIDRNYKRARAEIDIVALDGDTIVFVEVKTRSSADYGGPAAAVNRAKQKKLITAAHCFINERGPADAGYRFDVIALTGNASQALVIDHFEGAFILPV